MWSVLAVCAGGWASASVLAAQEPVAAETARAASAATTDAALHDLEPSAEWLRVTKDFEVWINLSTKQVMVGGRICLREGMLEMFACPQGTKEHESIVSVRSPARYVHAALVAIGARPGPPVRFEPTYQPAQGTEIDIEVRWRDAQGKEQHARAQDWVKEMKTGRALAYPWVFAGSGFWTDPDGKEQYYFGDGGDFICVSNFSTATLDLPVESSATNDELMFSAFTEHIPPRDTHVMLVLTPKFTAADRDEAQRGAQAGTEAAAKPEANGEAKGEIQPGAQGQTPTEPAAQPAAAQPAPKPAPQPPAEPAAPPPGEAAEAAKAPATPEPPAAE